MSNQTHSNALSYARAIYEIALEGWQKELSAVNTALADKADLITQLDDATAPFAKRQEQLDGVLPKNISAQTKNFLYTLLKDGNLSLLAEVSNNLGRLASKGPGVEVATVTSAVELTPDEQAQFKAKLSAQHGDAIEVDFKIDPAIMGGVIVQVGDKILDGSVAAKLNGIRDKLATG